MYAKTEDVNGAISEVKSSITEEIGKIDLSVYAKTEDVNGAISDIESRLAIEIKTRSDGSKYSQLSASAGEMVLDAGSIVINGDNFTLNKNGEVTAKAGFIAGFAISGDSLVGSSVGMCGKSGENYAFWAGSDNSSSAPFRVGHDGVLNATGATIEGVLKAGNGSTIAGFTLDDGDLMSDSIWLNGNSLRFIVNDQIVGALQAGAVAPSVGGIVVTKNFGIQGDLYLDRGSSEIFVINGADRLRGKTGWVKYLKSITDARYMHFICGILVEETDKDPGTYIN